MLAGGRGTNDQEKSRVIMLLNMVTQNELLDQQTAKGAFLSRHYARGKTDFLTEIEEDIQEECSKYGQIMAIKMPRPSGARVNAGVGKVYLKYDNVDSAKRAMSALAGRKFESRTVVVSQYPEELFDANAW
jgi:splicing factor U2AF 65 kDa subunit